ncbi:MAG TPA: hypothetical protein VL443_07960 [Cyclobacteriaceae bacterium]|jgi:hypothetical protein|nr:hypothetical protein [Cyclobacteriaceae bacterium]
MTFTDYLISKKIDQEAFQKAEPALFEIWKTEFEQMHPNSFTAQKLYLINPLRRKYTLPFEAAVKPKPVEKKVEAQPAQTNQQGATTDVKADEAIKSDEVTKTEESESKPVSPSPAKPARPVFKPKPKIS